MESNIIICKDCSSETLIDNSVFYWDDGSRRCFRCAYIKEAAENLKLRKT